MRQLTMDDKTLEMIAMTLRQSELFAGLDNSQLARGAKGGSRLHYSAGEVLMEEGDAADSFCIILTGEATVRIAHDRHSETIDLGRLEAGDVLGEMGPLLDAPRSATVQAAEDLLVLEFKREVLLSLFQTLPQFAMSMCRMLAARLQRASRRIPLRDHGDAIPSSKTLGILPVDFCRRNRVVALSLEDQVLTVGFVADPEPRIITAIGDLVPSVGVRAVRVDPAFFDRVMADLGVSSAAAAAQAAADSPAPDLDAILRRMVAEGASDLFLGGGVRPYWRIDGEVLPLNDVAPFGADHVLELLTPVLEERNSEQFQAENDTDFAYAIPGIARFRVNLF